MQKEIRKVIVTLHDPGLSIRDRKTGMEIYEDPSKMPATVRQWFTWDEYVDIEIDVFTGEAKVLMGDSR